MRFVDTNIVVYAEQPDAGAKHQAACAVLRDIWQVRDGTTGAQVLQEFYVTVTRKMPHAYAPDVALRILSNYLAWRVVPIDGARVLEAIRIQQDASSRTGMPQSWQLRLQQAQTSYSARTCTTDT
jgi:predicted nucleic acid-binding protein